MKGAIVSTKLPSQRHLFDLPRDTAYLNAAYIGPLSMASVAAGETGMRCKAAPWTIAPKDFFEPVERARSLAARLYDATADDIALAPSASYGLATAAGNLSVSAGQEILVLEDQFPSHVYIWQRRAAETGAALVTLPRADAATPDGGTDWTRALLDRIGDRTAIVAVPNCHWTDGSLVDLVRVGQKARTHGAALVLDLTQSLGALPFSARDVDPDFAVAASYKWQLGPYSLGTLYVAPRHHGGRPLEENWITRAGSEDFARLLDYQDAHQPGARRFDMGARSSFHLMPVLETAFGQLLDWGVPNIAATLSDVTVAIAERADAAFGLTSVPLDGRAGHFLGLGFPDGMPDELTDRLMERRVFLSRRGDSLRVTPHVYNDADDIDRLFEALGDVLGDG